MTSYDRVPELVVTYGLSEATESQLESLRSLLERHSALTWVDVKWYPPEDGKHSEMWVTLDEDFKGYQYRIGSRGAITLIKKRK